MERTSVVHQPSRSAFACPTFSSPIGPLHFSCGSRRISSTLFPRKRNAAKKKKKRNQFCPGISPLFEKPSAVIPFVTLQANKRNGKRCSMYELFSKNKREKQQMEAVVENVIHMSPLLQLCPKYAFRGPHRAPHVVHARFFHLRPPSNQPLGHAARCSLDDRRSQFGAFVIRLPFSSSSLPPLTRRSAFFTALPLTTTRSLSSTALVHPSPADGRSPETAPATSGEEVLHKTPLQPPACLANTKKMLPALFLSASPALSDCVLPQLCPAADHHTLPPNVGPAFFLCVAPRSKTGIRGDSRHHTARPARTPPVLIRPVYKPLLSFTRRLPHTPSTAAIY
ncbi:hypothetical protein, conserved in T.vivax [Trypanosoma vivax Y486]|uniref:Uncharacterized protein n=1 Tax=Trypanosoma vivax (strain Y486) TaxID=1055687 RepID=F9WUQ9_TRYVY|nr:hypothetical protein, conserved in T.vivax [Trypanosoma vivax Y486]|eukprot:CCD21308.1 hypothetical protein, conserved in T.vivax [Trypanosoma vivax Y486]